MSTQGTQGSIHVNETRFTSAPARPSPRSWSEYCHWRASASQRRQDLQSAVRQVARLLGGLPADVPADPEALKRGLNILTPAAAGMTKSRWRNVRALLTAALDLTGAKVRTPATSRPLDAAVVGFACARRRPVRARAALPILFRSPRRTALRRKGWKIGLSRTFTEHLKRNSLLRAADANRSRLVYRLEPLRERCSRMAPGAPDDPRPAARLRASRFPLSRFIRRRSRSLSRASRRGRPVRCAPAALPPAP